MSDRELPSTWQDTVPTVVARPVKRMVALAVLVVLLLLVLVPVLYMSLTGQLEPEAGAQDALLLARLVTALFFITLTACYLLNASCLQNQWDGKELFIRFTFGWVGLLFFTCLAALSWTGPSTFRFGGMATWVYSGIAVASGWAIVKGASMLIVAWLDERYG